MGISGNLIRLERNTFQNFIDNIHNDICLDVILPDEPENNRILFIGKSWKIIERIYAAGSSKGNPAVSLLFTHSSYKLTSDILVYGEAFVFINDEVNVIARGLIDINERTFQEYVNSRSAIVPYPASRIDTTFTYYPIHEQLAVFFTDAARDKDIVLFFFT